MSRGLVRQLLARRLLVFAESHKLPYKGGDGLLRTPNVFEQFVSSENKSDEELLSQDVPYITVTLGKVTQTAEGRLGEIGIYAMIYAPDSEQGYRDAENFIEAVEIDLIEDPWLDDGTYQLTGPWETNISGNHLPTFYATLKCNVEMPALDMIVGPDDEAIGDMI